MAELLFQGHASCRITTRDGVVIYIDPFWPEGYDLPADLILITHQHHDHNKAELVTLRQPHCRVLGPEELMPGGEHRTVTFMGVTVESVEACNPNHDPGCCMGILLTVDGVTLYHGGDTSACPGMDALAGRGLDWALLPIDGIYNMGPAEAGECACRMGAKHTVPIHTGTRYSEYRYDRALAGQMDCPTLTLLEHGETVTL